MVGAVCGCCDEVRKGPNGRPGRQGSMPHLSDVLPSTRLAGGKRPEKKEKQTRLKAMVQKNQKWFKMLKWIWEACNRPEIA